MSIREDFERGKFQCSLTNRNGTAVLEMTFNFMYMSRDRVLEFLTAHGLEAKIRGQDSLIIDPAPDGCKIWFRKDYHNVAVLQVPLPDDMLLKVSNNGIHMERTKVA